MSEKITPRTLSGFMELMPANQIKFNRIKRKLENVFESYGFYPLDTPVLEASEVLLAKAGGETEKQIYRFQKGDTDMTMRFDLTVPLAKFVAKNAGELAFPFKRYQIGKSFRGERAQKGRFREFYQCDIDIIGDGKLDLLNDAEMPAVIYDVFNGLGLEDFTVRINNRKVLGGFFDLLGVGNIAGDIMHTVDKIDKIGAEKVAAELQEIGVDAQNCGKIIEFVGITGSNAQVFAFLEKYKGQNELFDIGVGELQAVVAGLAGFGVPEKNYRLDLSIARGLDYYTGTVYETTFNKHPEIGSICSGGRYDNLAEFYTDRKLPGVGISIGLTRLFYVLLNMDPNDKNGYLNGGDEPPADVMILPVTDNMPAIMNISAALRAAGIRTQVYYEAGKFKNKLNYANRLGIPYVIFVGDDELNAGVVNLKDMNSGDQTSMSVAQAAEIVNKYRAEKASVKAINTEKTRP